MNLTIEEPIRLVKELKGAPLAILVLLSIIPVPVSQLWLEAHTGYSDKPVTKALAYLQEHGFIRKISGGWQISDGSRRLSLPLGPALPPSEAGLSLSQGELGSVEYAGPDRDIPLHHAPDSTPSLSTGNRNFSDSFPSTPNESRNFSEKNRNFSDSPLISSSINLNLKESNTTTNNNQSRNISDMPQSPENQRMACCLAEHGISLNARTPPLPVKITREDISTAAQELSRQNLSEPGQPVCGPPGTKGSPEPGDLGEGLLSLLRGFALKFDMPPRPWAIPPIKGPFYAKTFPISIKKQNVDCRPHP